MNWNCFSEQLNSFCFKFIYYWLIETTKSHKPKHISSNSLPRRKCRSWTRKLCSSCSPNASHVTSPPSNHNPAFAITAARKTSCGSTTFCHVISSTDCWTTRETASACRRHLTVMKSRMETSWILKRRMKLASRKIFSVLWT